MKNKAIAPEASAEWRAAMARFDEHLRRDAIAAATRRAYAAELRQFAVWASWHGAAATAVDGAVVRRFAAALADRRAAPAATARKLAALHAFFEMMREHGDIAANPVAGMAAEREPALAPEHVSRLLDRVPAATALELRDRALFELAYATALRAEQLVALDVACVDEAREQLRLGATAAREATGAEAQDRLVPTGAPAMRAIANYLHAARTALCGEPAQPALFVSKTGRRLSASDARRRLRAFARRTRVHDARPAHALHRSLQMQLLEAGADVRSIMPAGMSTTRTYTRVESARLRSAYARAHPRA